MYSEFNFSYAQLWFTLSDIFWEKENFLTEGIKNKNRLLFW